MYIDFKALGVLVDFKARVQITELQFCGSYMHWLANVRGERI